MGGDVVAMAAIDPKLTLALRTRTAAIRRVADTARMVAFITEATLVQRILTHIGAATDQPGPQVDALPDWEAFVQPTPGYDFDQNAEW